MDIISQFKQHLEDLIEALECYREKSDIFKETGETTKSLQLEVQSLYRKIHELEVENEKLRFELNEGFNDSENEINVCKFGELNSLKEEIENLKNLNKEQRDIISNYEELLQEEKRDKKNYRDQFYKRSDSMKKKLKEKNKKFKGIQSDLFKLQNDFYLIKKNRDELIKLAEEYKQETEGLRRELNDVIEENSDLKTRLNNIEIELNNVSERFAFKESRNDVLSSQLEEQENVIYAYERELSRLKRKLRTNKDNKTQVYFQPRNSDFNRSNSKYATKSFSGSIMTSYGDNFKNYESSLQNNLVEDLDNRISKLEKTYKSKARHKRSFSGMRNGKRLKTKKIEFFNNNKENVRNMANINDTPKSNNIMRNLSKEMKKFDRKIIRMKNYFIEK